MSGGHFDCRDHVLYELQDCVAREIGVLQYGFKYDDDIKVNPKTIEYLKQIASDLGKLGKIFHSLDWYLSGDTNEDDFIEDFETFYKETK